jgi:hypothetical protein
MKEPNTHLFPPSIPWGNAELGETGATLTRDRFVHFLLGPSFYA